MTPAQLQSAIYRLTQDNKSVVAAFSPAAVGWKSSSLDFADCTCLDCHDFEELLLIGLVRILWLPKRSTALVETRQIHGVLAFERIKTRLEFALSPSEKAQEDSDWIPAYPKGSHLH